MDELWDKISEVYTDFDSSLDYIDREIETSIPAGSPLDLYQASRHLIKRGGKRIRPVLNLLAYRSVSPGGNVEEISPIAVAVELIHTATIVHDDIIDKSTKRRSGPTVNAKWGDEVAILAGDLLFSRAFGMIGSHRNREVSEVFSQACTRLAEGEVLEAMHTRNYDMSEEVYLEVIERKTASLFEAAARSGALVGGGSGEEVEALARYGYYLGIGFQMTDDLLDVTSVEKTLGKPVGSDIAQGKSTFVILHALRNCSPGEERKLKELLARSEKNKDEVEEVKSIVDSCGSVKYSRKRTEYFMGKAKKELRPLPPTPAKEALQLIAESIIKRVF